MNVFKISILIFLHTLLCILLYTYYFKYASKMRQFEKNLLKLSILIFLQILLRSYCIHIIVCATAYNICIKQNEFKLVRYFSDNINIEGFCISVYLFETNFHGSHVFYLKE